MKLFRIDNQSFKIIMRYIYTIVLIVLLMLVLNYIFLIFLTHYSFPEQEPVKTVKAIAGEFSHNDDKLTQQTVEMIDRNKLWVQLVNSEGEVIYSRNKPRGIQSHYSLSAIAKLTRSFINDYPVFVWESDENLVILGYPKNSITKYSWFFYSKNFPVVFLCFIFLNISVTILLAICLGRRLANPLKGLVDGIFLLKQEQEVFLEEKGLYKALAHSINQTSLSIVEKNNRLRLRDTAIKNWIAGISHDVRTPLSMILGYSAVIEEDSALPEEIQSQAKIITENALRLRELVSNLNLATSLQYDMQPLVLGTVRLSNIAREALAECINSGVLQNCTSDIIIEDENAAALLDKKLFERAVVNLIINSAKHNKNGCHITITVPKASKESKHVSIIIADDGCGISEDKQNRLNQKDFFNGSIAQSNGLGLMIVKSIVISQHGEMLIKGKVGQGVAVSLVMPSIGA